MENWNERCSCPVATNPNTMSDNEDICRKRKVKGLRQMSKLRKVSLISLLFLVVKVSSASEKSSTVKWRGSSRNNWTQLLQTQTQGPDVSSPLHVAQCRATCLQKVITKNTTYINTYNIISEQESRVQVHFLKNHMFHLVFYSTNIDVIP